MLSWPLMDDDRAHECHCGAQPDPHRLIGLELKAQGRTVGKVLTARATPGGMRCRIVVSDPADVEAVKRIAVRLHAK